MLVAFSWSLVDCWNCRMRLVSLVAFVAAVVASPSVAAVADRVATDLAGGIVGVGPGVVGGVNDTLLLTVV